MNCLDCESPETTEQSLSALLAIARAVVHERCRAFDLHAFYGPDWCRTSELPRRILGIESPNSYPACYFHATRVIPADGLFADGLLPLHEAIDGIWGSLWLLARRYCSQAEWLLFRRDVETIHPSHGADLYRLKINSWIHRGPYGFLIRAVPICKATIRGPWHDYLGIPEIVEDICAAFSDSFRIDLARDYVAASRPCLVKFKAEGGDAFEIGTALLYLCHSIHGMEFDADLGACHDAKGQRIPPTQIVAVELDPQELREGTKE